MIYLKRKNKNFNKYMKDKKEKKFIKVNKISFLISKKNYKLAKISCVT